MRYNICYLLPAHHKVVFQRHAVSHPTKHGFVNQLLRKGQAALTIF